MNDKARNLHGHTTIELHNHKTGFRERIEHDNTFTDGITNYLLSSGYFDNSPFKNTTWRGKTIYRNLLGGILLFNSPIADNNGVYPTIMPAGNKMIANGSYGVANNSAVTEMGTYNSQESSFSNAGLTFVYDWSTSQGNGEIACVSLTSDVGGYIGYGNSVSQVGHQTKKSLYENQDSEYSTYNATLSDSMKGNYMYLAPFNLGISASSFTLTTKYIPVSEVNLFDFDTTKTVSIPSGVSNGTSGRVCVSIDNGKFCLVPVPIVGGTQYTLGIYDASADSWTTQTFTFSHSGTFTLSTSGVQALRRFRDGFCYNFNNNNYVVLLDKRDRKSVV